MNFFHNIVCLHFMCATWYIHICGMTHSYVWHSYVYCDSFARVLWIIRTYTMTHSYVYYDSFVRVLWLIRTSTVTHSQQRGSSHAAMPWAHEVVGVGFGVKEIWDWKRVTVHKSMRHRKYLHKQRCLVRLLYMGWLRFVGSLKWCLFCKRAL